MWASKVFKIIFNVSAVQFEAFLGYFHGNMIEGLFKIDGRDLPNSKQGTAEDDILSGPLATEDEILR